MYQNQSDPIDGLIDGCHAKRCDEHVHGGDQKYANHREVVDAVRLADVRIIFDVVPTVPDQTDADGHLKGTNIIGGLTLAENIRLSCIDYLQND